jgi:hypothetical protein
MSFSTDMANLVGEQLARFVTLNSHQLAGQVANLDFWLAQVRHALSVIDGYGVRYIQMHAAQELYVTTHAIVEFSFGDVSPNEKRAAPPRRIPDREMQKARRSLVEVTSRFLKRCQQDGLISESQVSEAWRSLGIE